MTSASSVQALTPLAVSHMEAALISDAPLPDATRGASLSIARAAGLDAFRAGREAAARPRISGAHAAEVVQQLGFRV